MTEQVMPAEAQTERRQDALLASGAPQSPRAALAARSLAKVDRIKDDEKRREAFRRHMTEFPPLFSVV